MATSTGPYAVALGTVLQLAPAQATGVYFSVVQIANSSPFLATVMVGGNQFLLQPFMADLYTLPTGGQPVSATFSQAPGGPSSAPGSTGSFCTATWYLPSDQITDAFPVALTAAAIMSALYQGPVTTSTFFGQGLTTTGIAPIQFGPATAESVKWGELTVEIDAASVSVPGRLGIFVTAASPVIQLMVMYVPLPVTFVPFSETVTFSFGNGGLAVGAYAGGSFELAASVGSATVASISGSASLLLGY